MLGNKPLNVTLNKKKKKRTKLHQNMQQHKTRSKVRKVKKKRCNFHKTVTKKQEKNENNLRIKVTKLEQILGKVTGKIRQKWAKTCFHFLFNLTSLHLKGFWVCFLFRLFVLLFCFLYIYLMCFLFFVIFSYCTAKIIYLFI